MYLTISGSISTPMACVLWIPAMGAISPTTVEMKKIKSPNNPVKANVMATRKVSTIRHSHL